MDDKKEEKDMRYGEDMKRANFKRLATKRTQIILERLRILGNLSSKTLYSYGDGDVDKIFTAIEDRLVEVKSRFTKNRKKIFEL